MNNIIKHLSWIILLLFSIAACSPQEMDDYSLSKVASITDDMVSFTQSVSPTSDNVITFTSTTDLPTDGVYAIRWDLGNGGSGNRATVTGQYPFAGEYTVTLSIHSANGSVARRSVVVSFSDDDFSLVDTPAYRNLTGGAENTEGKTWVFDQYNNFAAEIRAAGFNVNGHMGLGPQGSRSQEWWGAGANDKSSW